MTHSQDPPCFRCVEHQRLPLDGTTALMALRGGRCEQLPSALIDVLSACAELKPISDHASAIWSSASPRQKLRMAKVLLDYCVKYELQPELRWPLGPPLVATVLEHTRERGLLRSEDELIELARTAVQGGLERARISSLCLITRNRPAALGRALTSYIAGCQEAGRDVRYLVADDTQEEETAAANRRILSAIAERAGVQVQYIGAAEKRRLQAALLAEGLPPDVIEFALADPERCGYTAGANRNALLLCTAGTPLLCADDDTEYRMARAPHFRPGLRITEDLNHEIEFFPTREAVLAAVPPVRMDLLVCHEQLLGRTLGELFLDAPSSRCHGLAGAPPGIEERLTKKAARVLVTSTGWLGDIGADASRFFQLEGSSFQRSIASEAAYRLSRSSREVCRVSPCLTLTEHPFCMSTFLGLDNRELLPPFMPVHWGQDAVFGALVRYVHEDAYFGHLPFTLLHAREEPPRGSDKETKRTLRTFSQIVTGFIQRCTPPVQRDATARMQHLAAYIEGLGSMPREEFVSMLAQQEVRQLSASVAALEARLRAHPKALEIWRRDIQERITALRATLSGNHRVDPFTRPASSTEEAALRLQRLVLRFGHLLRHWPALWEATRRGLAAGSDRWAGISNSLEKTRSTPRVAKEPPSPILPLVSVIIPAFNDEERLSRCLAAVESQTYPPDRYEILVIDNGSQPPLSAMQERFPRVLFLMEARPGSYSARNTGVAKARGDVLAFTDSDCVPDAEWLQRAVDRLKQQSDGAVLAGAVLRIDRGGAPLSTAGLYDQTFFLTQRLYVQERGFCATANMVTTARTFSQVGPFRADLLSGGDREWSQRATRLGFPLLYEARAVVRHPTIESTFGVLKKSVRIVGGQVRTQNGERYPLRSLTRNVLDELRGIGLRWQLFQEGHGDASPAIRARMAGMILLLQTARLMEHARLFGGGRPRRQ